MKERCGMETINLLHSRSQDLQVEILFSKCKRACVCMWVHVGVCARLERGQYKQRLRASSRYGMLTRVRQKDIITFLWRSAAA